MSWPKFVSPSPKIWTWKQIETRKNRTQFFEDIMYITKLMVESIMEKKNTVLMNLFTKYIKWENGQ